ncbi:metalloproteinase inhibitor 3-like [Saccostrea echinata]|uniref:metalloproteinase inhibitor 3-like n=1 Tax=Saccostrea echinata TaxID=191078 RepID=UPI002A832E36|nr:metalloproteinase inhibitor 3-like [Saccostrea echinata]
MGRMKVALFCVYFVISVFGISEACKCAVRHPQTIICRSDFAIKAKILYEDPVDTLYTRYRVKVLQNFKSGYAPSRRNSRVWIKTASSSAACGVRFQKKSTYVIAGSRDRDGTLRANSCSLNRKVQDMTTFQLFALNKMGYQNNCNCEIRECPHNVCEAGQGCLSPYNNSDCYHRTALCRRSGSTCSWTPNAC